MAKGNKIKWEDELLKKGFTKKEDGSFEPPTFKESPYMKSLKNRQFEKVTIKEIVKPTTNFTTSTGYPITLNIEPVGKPRMTQRDKWLKPPRKPVEQYWKYKDTIIKEALKNKFEVPEHNFSVTFVIPMPHSWSEKKKGQMDNTPHRQRPDNDNLMKAFKDALCKEDSNIWDYRITKIWGRYGKIIINLI